MVLRLSLGCWISVRSFAVLARRMLGLNPHHRYTYYPELQTLYVCISKSASTSIRSMFLSRLEPALADTEAPHQATFESTHARLLRTSQAIRLTQDPTIFSFGITRDPLSRLISCYRHQILKKKNPRILHNFFGLFREGMGFESFVRTVCLIPDRIADNHFQSQSYSFFPRRVRIAHTLAKLENIDTEFPVIAERAGIGGHFIQKNKTGTDALDLRDWYTKELARKVYKRYQKDFELLGYKEEFEKLFPTLRDA